MKNWGDLEKIQENSMKRMDKIFLKQCVMFYSKVWKQRNEVFHDRGNHRKFVIDWHEKLKEKIESENRPEMKKHARKQETDVEKCDSSCIRLWNITMWKMMKSTVKEKTNDTRKYLKI